MPSKNCFTFPIYSSSQLKLPSLITEYIITMLTRLLFLNFLLLGLLTLPSCKSDYVQGSSFYPVTFSITDTASPLSSPIDKIIKRLPYLSQDTSILSKININADTLEWYSVSDSTFYTFSIQQLDLATPYEKNKLISTTLGFEPVNQLSPTTLNGLRIALDPGHSANDLASAKLEGKFIEFLKKDNPSFTSNTELVESELTFHTALVLKKLLENQGATVLLTRNNLGESAMGYNFKYWLNNHFYHHLDSLFSIEEITQQEYIKYKKFKKLNNDYTQKVLFNKLFNRIDFETRTQKINAFQPDATLILHYNVDINNDPWKSPTLANKTMVFVPGGFMKEEATKPEDAFHFLRLLFSDQLEESIVLSDYMIKELEKDSLLSIALPKDSISYLNNYSIYADQPGIFCRNLALTRKIMSPVCYLEPLYQDNIFEHAALSEKNILFENYLISKRVEDVANAYYKGIIAFIDYKKAKTE